MADVSPLLRALYDGRDELAATLLERAGPLDVFEAAAVGRIERLRELLAADPGLARAYAPDGFTALQLASFFGQPQAVRVLVEHGADVSAVARNPLEVQALHSAAAARGLESARLLLDAGADPNARQSGGFVPLHAAAQNGDLPLALLLLKAGAAPGVATDEGRTAPAIAREHGHEELARVLEGHG